MIEIKCTGSDSLPLDAINEFQGNLKKRTKKDIEKIITSIEKYGFSFPFFLWNGTGDNYCLDGHGRIQALAEMRRRGIDLPLFPVVYIEAEDEAEAKQKLLRLNSQYGQMSIDSVLEFVGDINIEFEELQLPKNLLYFPDVYEREGADGEITGEETPTKVQAGELWGLGDHILMCGDSTKDIKKLMGEAGADIVFTSPPYNAGKGHITYNYYEKRTKVDFYKHEEDNKTKEDYYVFLLDVLKNLYDVMKEEHSVFWNVMYNSNSRDDYGKIIFAEENPFSVKETIIWDKGSGFPTASGGILSRRCELVFLLSAGEKYKTLQKKGDIYWNYWNISSSGAQDKENRHTACFPVGLPEKALKDFSEKGDVVLDPFGGTGSTLIACENLNRKCYMMELDPHYCDVIINRWETRTGEKAVKIG